MIRSGPEQVGWDRGYTGHAKPAQPLAHETAVAEPRPKEFGTWWVDHNREVWFVATVSGRGSELPFTMKLAGKLNKPKFRRHGDLTHVR